MMCGHRGALRYHLDYASTAVIQGILDVGCESPKTIAGGVEPAYLSQTRNKRRTDTRDLRQGDLLSFPTP